MLGVRLGYYSEDPLTCWAIDSIVEYIEDMQGKFSPYIRTGLQGGEMTEAAGTQWVSDYWEHVVPIVNKRLREHGKPFIGGTDRPTIADFKAFAHVSTGTDMNQASPIPVAVH